MNSEQGELILPACAGLGQVESPPLPPPAARESDVDTSHDAAESLLITTSGNPTPVSRQRLAVLNAIKSARSDGKTADECDEHLNISDTAHRRCHELVTADLIVRVNRKRRTRRGRDAYVYVASDYFNPHRDEQV
jgi:hypothetical protein